MTPPELVTYDGLPAASGGAHGMRVRRAAAAHAGVVAFMTRCVEPVGTVSCTFRVRAGGCEHRSAHWRELVTGILGGPRRTDRTHWEWGVRDDRIDGLLAALDAATPVDVTPHGHSLAALVVNAPGRLIDPSSGAPYVGVSPEAAGEFAVDGYGRTLGASGVRATFGTAASSLSLWLSFPGDERLADAAAHVQAHVPVRLSAKHWRRWSPARPGNGYRSVRIPSPTNP
ncbi:hypothetical protein [Micromonospora wenchangensis]|uniref:hypothetical protein n=1 Tax=Micromonospora wenchangensis TaxID=1185415 RepID=UPI0037F7454F